MPLIREAHIHYYGSKEDLPGNQLSSAVGEQIEVCTKYVCKKFKIQL